MGEAYPFTAIVGQDEMKRALLVAAVDPTVGGVLVFGDRGTGKSTAVRALAALLPALPVVAGCPYRCAPGRVAGLCAACETGEPAMVPVPVVDLPLGATEDRVVGALDLERALTKGERAFEPGLLARANRGFLYIDEVNLLEDHLVDLLIDVAASGENVVEREGLSVRHPARFVLVGSGNPEEGELRPQLLDRFGLAVDVTTPQDVPSRVEIVRRRDAFDRDPAAFRATWAAAEAALGGQIEAARGRLAQLVVPDAVLEDAARLCLALGTDGLRAELTLLRAARAATALDAGFKKEGVGEGGAGEGGMVDRAAMLAVAPLALRHRLRRDPLDESGSGSRVARAIREVFPTAAPAGRAEAA